VAFQTGDSARFAVTCFVLIRSGQLPIFFSIAASRCYHAANLNVREIVGDLANHRQKKDRTPLAAPNIDAIVSLAKRRGFVYPSSEIYGGLGSAWDYGPLGVELCNNVKQSWWRWMVYERDDMEGLDSSLILNRLVWQHSGHEATFQLAGLDAVRKRIAVPCKWATAADKISSGKR